FGEALDHAVVAERRLEPRETLDGRARSHGLVAINNSRGAVRGSDRHRQDFTLKVPAGLGGPTVRFGRILVELLPRETPLRGDQLSRDALVDEPLWVAGAHPLTVGAATGSGRAEGHTAHRL